MDKLITFRNAVLWAATLLVVGCSGITPYDPPDDRENPPGRGLLSGADGEFVIYRKTTNGDVDNDSSKSKSQKEP